MTEPELLDLMRRTLNRGDAAATPAPGCLSDDTIAALAEGALEAAERAAALPHLATCARCRAAVASVARALADPSVARAVRAMDHPGRRRFLRLALPAAAAAILVAVVWPRWPGDGGEGHRGPPQPGAQIPTPIAPVGVVAQVPALRWASLAGADRYRLTLFDAAGRVLYEAELGDTTAALPDSVRLAPGRSYLWRVEARTGWNRWAASDLVEFSISRRPPNR